MNEEFNSSKYKTRYMNDIFSMYTESTISLDETVLTLIRIGPYLQRISGVLVFVFILSKYLEL